MVLIQFMEDLVIVMAGLFGVILANVCLLLMVASLIAVGLLVIVTVDFMAVQIFKTANFGHFTGLSAKPLGLSAEVGIGERTSPSALGISEI